MKKKICFAETAYILGIILLAAGTALMTLADFGMSMVVAPAYLLHLKVSQVLPFFSFGMAEYTFQAFLLLIMMLVLRKFKVSYLFSFVTAVIYGFALDGFMIAFKGIPHDVMAVRVLLFAGGMNLCSMGVAFMFHTYIAPEVYELAVKEISARYHLDINKFKTCYDLGSFAISVVLSFAFFGFGVFRGIHVGTVVNALVNGFAIGMYSRLYERHFEFKSVFKKKRLEDSITKDSIEC